MSSFTMLAVSWGVPVPNVHVSPDLMSNTATDAVPIRSAMEAAASASGSVCMGVDDVAVETVEVPRPL